MRVFVKEIDTPLGRHALAATDTHLIGIRGSRRELLRSLEDCDVVMGGNNVIKQAERELAEFFAGKRKRFSVRTRFVGGTEFQRSVWKAMASIPYGETRSYGWIAKKLGRPDASRAVGQACKSNPLPFVYPCHRVIGSDGKLTGFGGSTTTGLKNKERLLRMEGAL